MPPFFSSQPAWPEPDEIQAGLQRPKFMRLRFDRFPRGTDGRHIDVALGPALERAVSTFVSALVREYAQKLWKQPITPYGDAVVKDFRDALLEHHGVVVKDARSYKHVERVQLFQVSVVKLLLTQIDDEIAALRHELEDARSHPTRQLSGKSLQFHQLAAKLSRHAGHIQFQVARHLIRELMRLENGAMKNLRKSLLGFAWPIADIILSNPILQLDGIGGARDFIRFYPRLLRDAETAQRIDRCLLEALAGLLPDNAESALEDDAADTAPRVFIERHDQGTSRGFLATERWVGRLLGRRELEDGTSTWLDLPDNVICLLGGCEADWPQSGAWRDPAMARVQRELNKQFASRLAKADVMDKIVASYELAAIFPRLGLIDAEALLYDYLLGKISRREMTKRLDALDGVKDAASLLRRVEEMRKRHRASPEWGNRQTVARLAGDYVRLRRDLKYAWRLFGKMDDIRLIREPAEIELALDNNTLQLFCRDDIATDGRRAVVGHVIVRVDIRGAGELAAQMRDRGLQPAAHFSRWFYDPIDVLLERFGATKAAVDGDSLMLTVLEYSGDETHSLAVARACCMAVRLFELVATMNLDNERQELPCIELGLGIAYADQSPTYLYDHSRRVILSPAISRARQLSSCHRGLRQACPLPEGRGLFVVAPVRGSNPGEQPEADGMVRCNVDAIELDGAAFSQLHVEISLRKTKMHDKVTRRPVVMYAGRCTDTCGDSHLLVISEQATKLWMGKQLLETEDNGQRFYQVITDPSLIRRVDAGLKRAKGENDNTLPAVRPLT